MNPKKFSEIATPPSVARNDKKGISLLTITSIILDGDYYAALPATGPSMYPTIRSGDRVYIESLNGKAPAIGDIILYKSEDNMICHRLIRILKNDGVTYYQTRGDAFFSKDAPILYKQILGRVVKIKRGVMSLPRSILLLIGPIIRRFTILNALIVNAMVFIKRLAHS